MAALTLIRLGAETYEFISSEQPAREFPDRGAALAFLQQFRTKTGDMGRLRDIAARFEGASAVGRLSDDELLQVLAALLFAGRVSVAAIHRRHQSLGQGGAAPAAPPPRRSAAAAASPAPTAPPPEPEPSDDIAEAQVAALQSAAAIGTPFCEECERAKAGRQAA